MSDNLTTPRGLMILVAGPYRSGTGDNPGRMAADVQAMEAYTLPLFRAGHIPVVGEWLALRSLLSPAQGVSATRRSRKSSPHRRATARTMRCRDPGGRAITRRGLDGRVAEERGLRIFRRLTDVPGCASAAEPYA